MAGDPCKLCHTETKLRNSILPEFFYLSLYDDLHRAVSVPSDEKEKLAQKGCVSICFVRSVKQNLVNMRGMRRNYSKKFQVSQEILAVFVTSQMPNADFRPFFSKNLALIDSTGEEIAYANMIKALKLRKI